MVDVFILLIVAVAGFAVGYVFCLSSYPSEYDEILNSIDKLDTEINKQRKRIESIAESYKQIKYERDLAVIQLDELGYSIGETIRDEDIYKDPCETCAFSDMPEDYCACEECGEKGKKLEDDDG